MGDRLRLAVGVAVKFVGNWLGLAVGVFGLAVGVAVNVVGN